jgi:hypothetical protein
MTRDELIARIQPIIQSLYDNAPVPGIQAKDFACNEETGEITCTLVIPRDYICTTLGLPPEPQI